MELALGLQKVKLSQLQPDISNALIVGIIIAKQGPRSLKYTYANGDSGTERAVWNFTLRDSITYFINVTCWGTTDGITELNKKFNIGDVVDIHRPQIEIRKLSNYGEQFRPNVTSPYYLTLNDYPELNIFKHEGNNNPYFNLLHLPTKPIAGVYTIADIHNKRDKLEGVDVFGVVRQVGKIRTIKTRDGVDRDVREIIILDKTNAAFKIVIWNYDLIIRSGTWKMFNTVLFITNLRCEWSFYSRSMIGNLTSSTIITEDPALQETETLKKFAKEAVNRLIKTQNFNFSVLPTAATIQNVMNVKQILRKIELAMNSTTNSSIEDQQFTALVYAVITQLDLDGLSRCISTRCSCCTALITSSSTVCTNIDCVGQTDQEPNLPIINFDLRLMLTDHTGSLVNCKLSGEIAESVLNCDVQQFLALTNEEKSILKWKLLMERCSVRLYITCTGYHSPVITVVSCKLADPSDVSNKLPHY